MNKKIRRIVKPIIKKISNLAGYDIKAYSPPNYNWIYERKIQSVLDIGANTGQYALQISKILPESVIFSFEPIKSVYDELVVNTKNNNVKAYNFALGEKEDEMEMNVSQHTPSSSLLKMSDLHLRLYNIAKHKAIEKVKIKALDNIADELNIAGQNYLVKIDVQGFEDKVLKGGYNTIKNAQIIQIEMTYQELYKGQFLFDDIYKILIEMNFDFSGNISQKYNPSDGKLVYSDSIFIKKSNS